MRQTQTLVRAVCVGLAILFGVATQAAAQNGRYIVKFNPGRSNAGQAALRAAGGQVDLVLDPQDAVAARIPAGALNGLSRNPNIDYIEEDVIREPYSTWSNVSTTGTEIKPYGIQMVQADQVVINAAVAGAKKVCIIDSGYYDGHEDLKGGVTFSTNGGSGTWNKDSCGHGSHVAGTIAAIAGNSVGVVGVNPGVSLHIVKVFGDDVADSGSCGWTYSSTLVSALNACTNAGANVISMSLGGSLKSRTEENAFKSADANGVLSVAAAGNAGNKTTSYPAGYASVMSVAAVDATETVASFSQKNRDVEIAAPGVSVLSTVPWSSTNSLTSGATTWSGSWIEGAARTTGPGATGTIVDGGLCSAVGSWSGAVVLCERGTNSFAEKVANVKAGSGAAAVIFNNGGTNGCDVFSGTLNGTSTIPAIALSCADGLAAKGQAGSPGTVVSTVVYPPTSTGGYEAWDGTSMATPHASAVAALIWACNPTRTNAQVRDALNKSALDKGTAGRDTSYGFGIVQAKAALVRLGLGSCTVTP